MLHKIVSIEGNIGAGKTTLATNIAKATGRKLILEQFEQNPFLADFYAQPERYAFHTELFFLAERYEQWRQLPDIPIVTDYSLAKSRYFAEITLKGAELTIFNRIYEGLTALTPQPDIILYLHRSTEQLTEHIKQRGRSYEQDITAAYLQQIHDNYLKHLNHLSGMPIVLIDARDKDFQNPQDFDWIMQLLEKPFAAGITRL